jgi:transposase
MGRKGYPAEFRRRALDLVAAGKTVAEVARLLEVSDQSIYSWRQQEQIDQGELPGLSTVEREELRAARLRIRALETALAVHGGRRVDTSTARRRHPSQQNKALAGENRKSSDGLEPSTPPYHALPNRCRGLRPVAVRLG